MNLLKNISKNESSHGLTSSFKISDPKNPRATTGQRIDYIGPLNRKNTSFSTNATIMHKMLPNYLKDKEMSCTKFKKEIKLYSRSINQLPKHWNVKNVKKESKRIYLHTAAQTRGGQESYDVFSTVITSTHLNSLMRNL